MEGYTVEEIFDVLDKYDELQISEMLTFYIESDQKIQIYGRAITIPEEYSEDFISRYFSKTCLNNFLGSISSTKKLKINGWRDYFYGDRSNVRKEWRKINIREWDLKMYLAFLLSYLSDNIIEHINENRIRLTFKTLLFSITKNGREISKEFRCIFNENCTIL